MDLFQRIIEEMSRRLDPYRKDTYQLEDDSGCRKAADLILDFTRKAEDEILICIGNLDDRIYTPKILEQLKITDNLGNVGIRLLVDEGETLRLEGLNLDLCVRHDIRKNFLLSDKNSLVTFSTENDRYLRAVVQRNTDYRGNLLRKWFISNYRETY